MVQYGTVVNGVIVPDHPTLPEGTRVRLEASDVEEGEEHPVPSPTETYQEHIAALKQSIAETEAGVRGRSVEEVFDEIDRRLRSDLEVSR